MKPYFPMFFDISGMRVLVVGAGNIATRRIEALRKFGPKITVVAPEVSEKVQSFEDVEIINRNFQLQDLDEIEIVIIATGDADFNKAVAEMCRGKKILKNVTSDQSLCDFFFPATVMTDEVVVGISSGGDNHTATKDTRKKIQELLEN
ncbi:MAG: bifunctional precorrin-2 dehydrogenase/sirohydrochlorin ferrochelatase [Lachnospiraceae bacterium]|nr:bifunctional precorrin-2 dehydrogenase/sirohydrochlorin ferrochelatase [Lachnospiraceae bacterium]